MSGRDEDSVEVGALRIGYQRAGDGPPLVLLHGLLTDGRQWRRQIAGLCDQFSVVAWDAPGCGASTDPSEQYRMADYADCLAAFIVALELDQPHVLGLSFGGALALELYRRHPRIPRTLVLASAYAGWAGSLTAQDTEQRLQQALREAEQPPERFVPTWIPALLTQSASSDLVNEITAIMSEFHPVGLRCMAHSLAESDLRDVLPHIDVPTLLLHGDADVRSPLSVAQDLHARITNSQLVVIPGVGHLANVQAPDRFNAATRAFLRSARAQPP